MLPKPSLAQGVDVSTLRALVDGAQAVIYVKDLEGRHLYANDAYARLAGIEPAEIVGRTDTEIVGPEIAADFVAQDRRVLESGAPLEVEHSFDHRGRTLSFLTLKFPLRDETGRIHAVAGMSTEITRLKEAEAAAKRGREELRLVTEIMPQLVWSGRADGYIDYCNQNWIEYTGLDLVKTQGAGWADALHPEDYQRTVDRWMDSVRTGQMYEVVYRFKRASDGAYRWFIGRALPLRDEHGKVVRWFGTCTDIHDAKMAEERATRAGERIALLGEASIALASSLDWDTTLHNVVSKMLPALGDFGFFDVVEKMGPDGPLEVRRIARALDERRQKILDGSRWVKSERKDMNLCALSTGETALHPDIDEAWMRKVAVSPEHLAVLVDLGFRSMLSVPLTVAGSTIGALTLFFADSGRRHGPEEVQLAEELARRAATAVQNARLYRELQDALKRRDEALEHARVADRRKDEFLAMLGHELRNPLAPILTALELQKMRSPGPSREREVIERQVRQLVGLVHDLLDLSRVTRGKIELQPERIALSAIVGRGVEMAAPLIEEKRHRFEIQIEEDVVVDADPVRLAQIVGNLVSNAAKYTDPRGRVSVRVSRDGDHACIEVADDGMGIPGELLGHIFEPFVQGERPIDRRQGGLGVGLTIVKSLVELHGGTVSAESPGPGKGSTFRVRLPAASASSPPSPARAGDYVARARHRVLVVDDNVDAAGTLVDALRAVGHEVAEAHDGPSAIETAGTFSPEIAILDIGLPGLDGYELAKRLRERSPRIRLIALTGYGQDSDRVRAESAGFDAHLVKPAELTAVLRAISGGLTDRR